MGYSDLVACLTCGATYEQQDGHECLGPSTLIIGLEDVQLRQLAKYIAEEMRKADLPDDPE